MSVGGVLVRTTRLSDIHGDALSLRPWFLIIILWWAQPFGRAFRTPGAPQWSGLKYGNGTNLARRIHSISRYNECINVDDLWETAEINVEMLSIPVCLPDGSWFSSSLYHSVSNFRSSFSVMSSSMYWKSSVSSELGSFTVPSFSFRRIWRDKRRQEHLYSGPSD